MKQNTLFDYCKENNILFLLDEWDYERNSCTPNELSYGANQKVWWKCKYKHSWEAKVANRTILQRGCPYCSGRKTLSGFNDFKTWCLKNNREDLLLEWDYDKNSVAIDSISPQNSKKVWWKCALGHEWDATIGSRTNTLRPAGCPYCSKPPKRILIGFNDLESWCIANHREELLQEWDSEKNTITPKDVTFGSGKVIWWKCNKSHKWKTAINNRTCGSKTLCPICTRTQSSFPEQAVAYYLNSAFNILQRFRIEGYEVDIYLTDYRIAIEYDGRFFHENEDSILRDRIKNKALNTAGIQLIRIKETIDVFKVEDKTIMFPASNGKYTTKHFELALVELLRIIKHISGVDSQIDINIARDELQIRAYYMNNLKSNSVAAVFPDLISEWDIEKNNGVDAFAFSARNNKKVWWKCINGHSWYASIHSRTVRKLGCPFCAGQRTIVGENDLETWCIQNNPLLLAEWDQSQNTLTPSNYQKTSNKVVWWVCSKGHKWQASIANRVHGTNCPVCNTGRIEHPKRMSLYEWCVQNNNELLLSEWNTAKNGEKTPKDYSYGSHSVVWWKCSKGHEWQAVIKSRRYNHGCPYCSPTFKKALVGINDLATWCHENNREDILSEWNTDRNLDISPEEVTKGSHKRIWWKCALGHEWEAEIKARTQVHGNTCPYCKQK